MKEEYLAKKNRPREYSMETMKRLMRSKLLTLFNESEEQLLKLINNADKEWINNIERLFPAQTHEERKWLRREMRYLERKLYTFHRKYCNTQMMFIKQIGKKWQIKSFA